MVNLLGTSPALDAEHSETRVTIKQLVEASKNGMLLQLTSTISILFFVNTIGLA